MGWTQLFTFTSMFVEYYSILRLKPSEFAKQCHRLRVLRLHQDIRGSGVLSADTDCFIHTDSCTFMNNVGWSSGVFEFYSNVKAVIVNSKFFRNNGIESGVLLSLNSSVVINTSYFLHADDHIVAHLAIVAQHSSLTMFGDVLEKSPPRTTGMIKITNHSSLLMKNISVAYSMSTIGKNALFQCEDFSNCTFSNVSFGNNQAPLISGVQDSTVNLLDCNFITGTRYQVMVTLTSRLFVQNCSFIRNNGTLLDITYNSSLYVENTIIANHSAESDEKMILIENNSTSNLKNCVIFYCDGNGFMGISFHSSVTMRNVSIQFNEVNSFLMNIFHQSMASISNCTIYGNIVVFSTEKLKVASVIIVQQNSRISAKNSLIFHNSVWSRTGKTIDIRNGSMFVAERCTFKQNIAPIGGAASCEANSSILWTNSVFSYNKGSDYGGDLHSENCVVTIENCSMTFNSIMHLKGSNIASHGDILQVSTNHLLTFNIHVAIRVFPILVLKLGEFI